MIRSRDGTPPRTIDQDVIADRDGYTMSKALILRYVIAAVSSCVAIASALGGEAPKFDASMLPMLLIGYADDLSYGTGGIGSSDNAKSAYAAIQISLELSLDSLHADIPRKLAFVREAFVVQPEIVGNKITGHHQNATLYVTTPVPDLQGGIVAILSSDSPQATTVFLVDGQLKAELVYDSTRANRFVDDLACDPMGQVISIRTSASGHLLLQELNAHWSSKKSRRFDLDLTGHAPKLHCVAS
jgi:hypothetical protein